MAGWTCAWCWRASSIVLGEVLRFHIDDALFENFKIDPDNLHPIGRMGGPAYKRTTDRLDMVRPKAAEVKTRA
jgi:flavin reductase (DIM6/NTAB) family NADH-FMN oxidoreductase RutF